MSGKNEQGAIDVHQKNVLQAPLHKHTSSGFCTASDPIAATLNQSFISFASSHDIALPRNAQAGDRACLSASNWKTATEQQDDAPRVKLEGTHRAALDSVDLGTLKKWARFDLESKVERPGERPSGTARESTDIGASEPRA